MIKNLVCVLVIVVVFSNCQSVDVQRDTIVEYSMMNQDSFRVNDYCSEIGMFSIDKAIGQSLKPYFMVKTETKILYYNKLMNELSIYNLNDTTSKIILNRDSLNIEILSFDYDGHTDRLVILDDKHSVCYVLNSRGMILTKFPLSFKPMHVIILDSHSLLFYNPFPRNQYSNGFLLTEMDFNGRVIGRYARDKRAKYPSKYKYSYISKVGNKIVTWNSLNYRRLTWSLSDKSSLLTKYDFSSLFEENIRVLRNVGFSDKFDMFIGTYNNLYVPLLYKKDSRKMFVFDFTQKNHNRLTWGLIQPDSSMFWPFDVLKNGTVIKERTVLGDVEDSKTNGPIKHQIMFTKLK